MEAANLTKMASCQKPTNSCSEAAISGSLPTAPSAKKSTDLGFTLDVVSAVPSPKVSTVQIDSYKFGTFTYKKITIGDSAVNTVNCHPQFLFVVHNSPFLPVILKREQPKALFVNRFNLEVSTDDVGPLLASCFT
jgi:hypothetical protein